MQKNDDPSKIYKSYELKENWDRCFLLILTEKKKTKKKTESITLNWVSQGHC